MDPNFSGITLSLIDPLYEAATRPEMWKVFLQEASSVMQSEKAAILLHSPGNQHTSVCFDLGVSDEMRRDTEELIKFSPWAAPIRKHQTVGWYSGCPDDLLPLEKVRDSFFYNEYYCKHKIEWAATTILFGLNGSSPSLAFSRPKTAPKYSPDDKEILKQLVPHLARTFKIHSTVAALRDKSASGQHAMDLMGSACITLDSRGRILSMNKRAEVLLAEGSTLCTKNHQLVAAVAAEQNSLDSCIAPASACGAGKSLDPGPGAVALHSSQGKPLYVSILPYRSSWSLFERCPAALVFITPPEEQGRGEHRLWQSMFALSPAECRVAEMMRQGMEVTEISETMRIKVDTVRYYQKSVYRKMGVRGQGQLMRLLVRLPSIVP